MRVIAGKYKGRLLKRPPEHLTRPTSSRTREAIFNILQHHPDVTLQGSVVWDVFAGSGALGLEALSRGATYVTFVEKDPQVIQILQENIDQLGIKDDCTILRIDATQLTVKGVVSSPADVIFLDPPYDKNLELPTLLALQEQNIIKPETIIVLETSKTTDLSTTESQFTLLDQRTYGAAKVSLFRAMNIKLEKLS